MIQNVTSVEAHNRSEVSAVALLPSNKLVSIGLDCFVKMWDLRNLQQYSALQLKQTYLTSLSSTCQQLIIGTGNGQLLFLDPLTLATHRTLKLHEDSINDIKVFENELVTVSSDGSLSIFDLKASKQIAKVQVEWPINQVEKYNYKYYLGGIRSFQINSQFKAKKYSEVSRFLTASNRLFGTSDEKGFFGLSPKFNTYVPCQNMIAFNSGILGTSWSTVSFFSIYEDDDRISYRSTLLPEMEEGQSFTGLATVGKRVFAGSESGRIYAFNVNDDYHCYD